MARADMRNVEQDFDALTVLRDCSLAEPHRVVVGRQIVDRSGSVDLIRFRVFSKWFSASVTPPPLRASAG